MNKIDSILPELLNILMIAEGTLKSSRDTILTVERTSSKRKSSSKKRKKPAKKQKNQTKPKKQVLKKADDKKKYFHYNIEGHQRRNNLTYLMTVKNRKKDQPSEGMSDLLVIKFDLTIFSSSNWILDSGSSAYLCTSVQGLEEVRGLKEGQITLRVGNGARVVAVAIGIYPLQLSLDISLILKDCYYIPITSRNLIFKSMLAQDNYNFYFNKDMCAIYFGNKVVARAFLMDGLYHLHMDASVNNNE